MRMMLKANIPTEAGNKAVADGTLGKLVGELMGDIRPEAAYFFAENGQRSALLVFDMKDTSDIPPLAERFFLGLGAAVDFRPVMNAEDLQAGLQKIADRR